MRKILTSALIALAAIVAILLAKTYASPWALSEFWSALGDAAALHLKMLGCFAMFSVSLNIARYFRDEGRTTSLETVLTYATSMGLSFAISWLLYAEGRTYEIDRFWKVQLALLPAVLFGCWVGLEERVPKRAWKDPV